MTAKNENTRLFIVGVKAAHFHLEHDGQEIKTKLGVGSNLGVPPPTVSFSDNYKRQFLANAWFCSHVHFTYPSGQLFYSLHYAIV